MSIMTLNEYKQTLRSIVETDHANGKIPVIVTKIGTDTHGTLINLSGSDYCRVLFMPEIITSDLDECIKEVVRKANDDPHKSPMLILSRINIVSNHMHEHMLTSLQNLPKNLRIVVTSYDDMDYSILNKTMFEIHDLKPEVKYL